MAALLFGHRPTGGKGEYSSPVHSDKRVVKEGFFRMAQLLRPPRVSGRRGIGWPICHELAAGEEKGLRQNVWVAGLRM
jgi:hypothetical protein